jgi:XapX domain-containing protein
MKAYLVALAVGLLVGTIYGFLKVRSPAPPVIALVGLLGILLGEQLAPLVRHTLARERPSLPSVKTGCIEHVLGELPGAGRLAASSATRRTRDT